MGGIIKISGREIGEGNPTFIVAEGCDNHLGDITVAQQMVVRGQIREALKIAKSYYSEQLYLKVIC